MKTKEWSVRWLVRDDLEAVSDIERRTVANPWSTEKLIDVLRRPIVTVGLVADSEGSWFSPERRIGGFVVYELHKKRMELLRFAVDPSLEQDGIKERLVAYLKDRISQHNRDEIAMTVCEKDLRKQLFLKSEGFLATTVLRGYCIEGCDAYRMQYRRWHTV